MSATQVTQEIQITGSLLSLNVFEQKLMRNFYIINTKLKRLDELQELDIKIKALEKQQKFMNNKMQAMAEKLPKDGSLSRNQVKLLAKDQVFQVLNSKDDRLNTCKYTQDLLKQIHGLKVDLARVRVQGGSNQGNLEKNNSISSNRASFTAGQVLLQQNKKIPRQSLQQVLDNQQMSVVDGIIKNQQNSGNPVLAQINYKFADIYRKIEQLKLGKMFNEYGDKDVQKFQKYEHYQQKSQQTTRKLKQKPIRLDGIKKQNIKGQILKNDLYAQYQRAQMIRQQMNKTDGRKSNKGQSLLGFKDDTKNQIKIFQDYDGKQKQKQRLKPSKSVRKLQRIQRRLKVDDIKQINSVLKQIELRIQGRVTHEIFMGFVEDIQQKLQILRITKDPTNELSQLRKMIYSLQNRMQAVIIFLQNATNQDDALLVKKQWTCISCDKNVDKYNAKVGQHLNWDNLVSKKISPTKAGAFGQTGQLANKIRSLMQNQKGNQGE